MPRGTVLVIGSNARQIDIRGGAAGPTGQYLNETVAPVIAVIEAGYDVVLATPIGRKPHLDEASDSVRYFEGDERAYQRARQFFATDASMNRVRTLRSVLDDGLSDYAGLFVPGGQAPVVDLMQDPELGEILRYFHGRRKPTAFLGHGPIATVAAMPDARGFRAALVAGETANASELAKGWPYAGYRMTVFSNTEERVIEDQILHGTLLFTMLDALEAAGATVITNPVDFQPHVIEDGELITGQNSRSDHQIAATLIAALDRAAGTG